MGIANRDIKLDNILLHGPGSRPVVKICDFGYSKDEVAGSICKTACGTPEYMAPEVRHGRLAAPLAVHMQHVVLRGGVGNLQHRVHVAALVVSNRSAATSAFWRGCRRGSVND